MEGLIPPWQPGQVQVVVSRDPRAVIPALQQQLLNGEGRRLMLQLWEELPRHGEILDEVLRQLAAVARALWPAWYEAPSADAGICPIPFGEILARPEELSRLQHRIPRLSAPWLRQAAALAAAGSLPVIHGFGRTLQCEQLALALGLRDGLVLLGVSGPHQPEDRLRSLAGVCSWLAATVHGGVVLVVPPELAGSNALESITYRAADLTRLEALAPADAGPEEEPYQLWPVIGQPHPCSPGEQLLAARLATDDELAGLFRFNQPVPTALGTRHLVDLLWNAGKLIVEVDGYRHHGHPLAFSQDRQRDYELMVSGYLVLRLPHSEVVGALDTAVAKIRTVVRFRRRQQAASGAAMP